MPRLRTRLWRDADNVVDRGEYITYTYVLRKGERIELRGHVGDVEFAKGPCAVEIDKILGDVVEIRLIRTPIG